ncbi:uncharacterized mitochondrial protein AtMg00810-like [Hibiscus syriacus]|uniref:uncharacterized mitochondrial protein AtMg00810-like n=1 Tax=Hibiscus syriacus TaxID=106335 RepID=UPI001920EB26|nr:uncharacterized mitochondrial protein AtMg00810-like [Hibiscus syriacus]
MLTRSKCGVFKPKFYVARYDDMRPLNVHKAIQSPHWRAALHAEIEALRRNGKHKARLVAKGYSQMPGYDFGEIFSPVVFMQQPPGFEQVAADAYTSLFVRWDDVQYVYILVYVDDIVLTGSSNKQIDEVVKLLGKEFALKDLGDLHFFLGIEVKRCGSSLILSQRKFIVELLMKTKMNTANPTSTPMLVSAKLSQDKGVLLEDAYKYRSIVGALLYVCHTRTDITFSVNKASQYMYAPRQEHLVAVKRILRYLVGTINHGLVIAPAVAGFNVVTFADADWVASKDDRKSVSDYCVFVCDNLIIWNSKKQNSVSRSTMEVEYRSVVDVTTETTWVDALLSDLGFARQKIPIVWCDNSSAVAMTANNVYHAKSTHVELNVHFVHEKVALKQVLVNYVPGSHQVADGFTKPLVGARFENFKAREAVRAVASWLVVKQLRAAVKFCKLLYIRSIIDQ